MSKPTRGSDGVRDDSKLTRVAAKMNLLLAIMNQDHHFVEWGLYIWNFKIAAMLHKIGQD